MQCWQCGADVQPGERTCSYCGARLTSPPSGRPRSSQQRYPSPRSGSRNARDDEWESDAASESDYGSDDSLDDASRYGSAYRSDDRRGSRNGPPSSQGSQGSRGRSGSEWGASRTDWRDEQRGRSRGRQQPEAQGGYPPDEHDQSGEYDDYASREYDANSPDAPVDPLNDPRAPNNLRSNARRGPDSRSGYSREGARDGSRDDRQSAVPPSTGDSRSRRPPTDPSRGRRDESGYRGRGYGPDDMQGPGRQGYPPQQYEGYEEPGRPRRSQASSADNRYSRSSISRGQPSPYDDEYRGGGYGADEYTARQPASRREYGRRMPLDDDSSWDQHAGSRGRSLQQRWGETLNSLRIPGVHSREDEEGGKSPARRIVTTIVLLLALATAVVAGVIVVAPRLLSRLNPAGAPSSSLCTASGGATGGAIPTATSHFKQFSSSRSLYGMNYPETWTVEPEQKAASGYDYIDVYTLPNSSTLVSVEQAQAACALTDSNIIQGEVAAAQQQNITFTETTSATKTQTIGGETWQRREYDVSEKSVTLHMVILACHHQGRAYVIVLLDRTTTFAQNSTGIFEPMLKSFTFTK